MSWQQPLTFKSVSLIRLMRQMHAMQPANIPNYDFPAQCSKGKSSLCCRLSQRQMPPRKHVGLTTPRLLRQKKHSSKFMMHKILNKSRFAGKHISSSLFLGKEKIRRGAHLGCWRHENGLYCIYKLKKHKQKMMLMMMINILCS